MGGGGLEVVNRALESRLGREEALKVLPKNLAKNSSLLIGFERETRALAALSHPNILSIFDVGKDQDILFAVMELLDGMTLRMRLGQSRITWQRALEISTEIAYGLAAAHSKGIIHRDLKPENIF